MDAKKSVVHIPRRFVVNEWGGSETFIAETSKRLLARGYPVEIMTTQALDSRKKETYEGIPIRRYPYFYPYFGLSRRAKQLLDKKAGNLFSFSLWFALFKAPSVGIMHLHTGKRLGGIVRFCAKKRNIPYVVSLHGGKLAVPQEEQQTWVEPTRHTVEWGRILGMLVGSRKVLSDAGAIICVGYDEYQAILKQYPSSYVEYLPNGVDITRFAKGDKHSFRKRFKIADDRFVLLTVARIDVQKNQLGLVRQLKAIREVVPNVHYVCLGHVTNEQYLQSMLEEAASMDVADALTVIPGLAYDNPALVDAYHAADCFVLPSLHEPFGMVVLEAWASGLCVAVSKRGGLASLVEDTQTGLFFDPQAEESDQQSMKEVICSLAQDASLRGRLAAQALTKAQMTYSWDRITDKLEEIYRRVHEHTVS